jgi:hypothetical protein
MNEKKIDNIWGKMDNKYPFSLPDDYFEVLPETIMDRIDSEGKAKGFSFIRFMKPAIGLAASFLLIMALVYAPVKLFTPKTQQHQISENFIDDIYDIFLSFSDHKIIETLYNAEIDGDFNAENEEAIILASVSEYDIFGKNSLIDPD